MRGKLTHTQIQIRLRRNIPAYAGKTLKQDSVRISLAEHPRVCGENCATARDLEDMLGTSPRMRGKPPIENSQSSIRRNIPAYAGKTSITDTTPVLSEEHPRVCGENIESKGLSVCVKGTSPRMRGKLWAVQRDATGARNIPAYAGKTQPEPQYRRQPWEHPRVCGENFCPATQSQQLGGTSPRMRGKRIFATTALC